MTAKSTIQTRTDSLRRDPEISRWIKAHRSESTAKVQLAQLELFCRKTGTTPDELVHLGKAEMNGSSKKFEDVVLGWIESERKAGRPDSYVSVNFAAIRSWLKHEEAAPSWTPKLKVRFGTTILNEVVPTPEQLRAVLDRTPVPRLQALLLFLSTSGVRIGVLGNEYRPDGLRLRHLPDLALSPRPHFETAGVAKVEVPAELSKAGNPYFTFITEETKDAIVRYLEVRVARGEKLTPES
ncbi:integrase/recombinase, partial [mine drainage metagenome]